LRARPAAPQRQTPPLDWLELTEELAHVSNSASFLRPVTDGTVDAICRRRSREADR
jgi:hypothetical protein